jgi:hypothetical protein
MPQASGNPWAEKSDSVPQVSSCCWADVSLVNSFPVRPRDATDQP